MTPPPHSGHLRSSHLFRCCPATRHIEWEKTMGALGRRSNMINHKIDEHMQFESYLSLHIMIIYIRVYFWDPSVWYIYIYIYLYRFLWLCNSVLIWSKVPQSSAAWLGHFWDVVGWAGLDLTLCGACGEVTARTRASGVDGTCPFCACSVARRLLATWVARGRFGLSCIVILYDYMYLYV